MSSYEYEEYEEYVDDSYTESEDERDYDELVEDDTLSADEAAFLRGCEKASFRESDDEEEDY